jgi:hypothetical protein
VIGVDPSDTNRVFTLVYENSAWKVYFTLDGGTSWQSVAASGWEGSPYRLLVNPSNGSHLAAASSSGLYSSTNGGATWIRVTTAFGSSVEAVLSDGGQSLVVGTSTQGIWKWVNWAGTPVQVCSNPSAITSLYESNEFLYAGTPASSVWRSYFGTGTDGSSSSALPGFSLSVQPNPVSGGMASASFTLPSSGEARLSVYNITGRLVETVANQLLPGGEHTMSFSTSNYAPGVYFTRLEHLSSSSTVRMVVTR